MPEPDDIALLKQYADKNSESAFAELVTRYVNLVYSAALRSVGNAHAAQEITQAVFIILARKAHQLPRHTVLSGWLYQTARLTAGNYMRTEIRRQNREQEAYMQSILNEPESEAWRQISPLLDDAMGRLGEKDRNAIVLRFFENKNLHEVGLALGASEDAAKIRVNRALEKLRKFFTKRGVALSGAIIAGAVSANSVQAAPVTLAKTISAVAVAKGAAVSGSTLALVKGALKIMAWTKLKIGIISAVIVVGVATTTTTLVIQHQHHMASQNDVSRAAWAFSGYGEPKSAMMSFLWAVRQADGEQILAACSPGLQQTFQKHFEKQMQASGKPLGEFISQDAPARFKNTSGIRILEQKSVSADQVVLRVWDLGEQKGYQITVKKIGDEWKVDGVVG